MHVSADHLLAQARERFAVQDYYGAAHILQDLVASGRSFADAHHLLGLCRALLGQKPAALEEFEQALRLNPRYIEANIHRGILLNELGRPGEAEEAFKAATAYGAGGPGGFSRPVAARLANQHAQLGEAYAEAGAVTEAIEQLTRAVELGPAFHDLRYPLARLPLQARPAPPARAPPPPVPPQHPPF